MITTAAAVALAALLGYLTDELRMARERRRRQAGEVRTRAEDRDTS